MSNRSKLPEGTAIAPGADAFAPIRRQKMRGRPFGPGNPGRPFPPGHTGRPKGARNKSTTMLKAMFAGEAEKIGRRAIDLAMEGQVGAIKLVLDRAYPVRQGGTVDGFNLPPITTAADAVRAMSAITAAVSAGTLTVAEARDLSALIEAFRKILELADIERRVVELERASKTASSGT